MMTVRAAVAVVCLQVLAGPPAAGAAGRPTRLSVDLDFSTRYDSNVLQYSEEDERAFLRNEPASRFAIRSLDDAVFRTSASVAVSRAIVGRRASALRYTYTTYRHGQDPVEDYEAHVVSLRQPFLRTAWATVVYSHVPSYYVRELWDDDFTSPYRFYPRYQAATYRSDRVSLRAGWRPWSDWGVSARADVRWQDYNPSFDERDATSWAGSLRLSWAAAQPLTIGLEPVFIERRARGSDPARPSIPDSLRADVSYQRGGVTMDARLDEGSLFRRAPELSVEVSAFRTRYTTDRVADVYHHGRRDTAVVVDLDAERTIRPGAALFAMYEVERARSTGTNAPQGRGDVGSFDVWRIGGGVRLSWSGVLP